MRLSSLVWGLLAITAGVLLLLDVLPGASAFAPGPKLGIGMVLLTWGTLLIATPLTAWYLRRTTRPEDYEGTCPVGRVCPRCDAFNFNPRTECRVCGSDLAAGSEREVL